MATKIKKYKKTITFIVTTLIGVLTFFEQILGLFLDSPIQINIHEDIIKNCKCEDMTGECSPFYGFHLDKNCLDKYKEKHGIY